MLQPRWLDETGAILARRTTAHPAIRSVTRQSLHLPSVPTSGSGSGSGSVLDRLDEYEVRSRKLLVAVDNYGIRTGLIFKLRILVRSTLYIKVTNV